MGTGSLYVSDYTQDDSNAGKKFYKRKSIVFKTKCQQIKEAEGRLIRSQSANSKFLKQERTGLNVTQREESLVVQYLALGGYRHWLRRSQQKLLYDHHNVSNEPILAEPNLACSGVHSGPGQLSFGYDSRHRVDLTLLFEKTLQRPAIIFMNNYHEHKVHYRGHENDCPQLAAEFIDLPPRTNVPTAATAQFWADLEVDPDMLDPCISSREHERGPIKIDRITSKMDLFKRQLAEVWSCVSPTNVLFMYTTSTACDFFHGADIRAAQSEDHLENEYKDLELLLEAEFLPNTILNATQLSQNNCRILLKPPRPDTLGKTLLSESQLVSDIVAGTEQGFVTLQGGTEKLNYVANNAADYFGFCVQNVECKSDTVSSFTTAQVAQFYGWDLDTEKGRQQTEDFLNKQPARTLNSTTFLKEETVSTSYLQWLIKERNFSSFKITHFIRYKMVNYCNKYLLPLLQSRHNFKKQGNTIAADLLKLLLNAYYGVQALEGKNYDTTTLTTGHNLSLKSTTKFGHLSAKNISNLGVVRMKVKTAVKRVKTGASSAPQDASQFFDDEAREQPAGSKVKRKKLSSLDTIEPFSESDWDSEDNEPNDGDLTENLLNESSNRCRYKVHFLYAVTYSGKDRRVRNNLPGAVAVLSNSKKLFLGHILDMLQCSDPRLCELCYIDTDSCIFSMTHPDWQDCLLQNKLQYWNSKMVMADETADKSCHGQMKLEGIYTAGLFKTLKIYRLYDQLNPFEFYTRCKGVNRHIASKLPHVTFDSANIDRTVVTRTSLRPTPAGQICVTKESRNIAVAFNFKRLVSDNGIHTFPISYIAEC